MAGLNHCPPPVHVHRPKAFAKNPVPPVVARSWRAGFPPRLLNQRPLLPSHPRTPRPVRLPPGAHLSDFPGPPLSHHGRPRM